MLGAKDYLPLINFQIRAEKLYGVTHIVWDKASQRFKKLKATKCGRILAELFLAFHSFIFLSRFLAMVSQGAAKLVRNTASSIFSVSTLMGWLIGLSGVKHAGDSADLLNAIMKIDQESVKPVEPKRRRMTRTLSRKLSIRMNWIKEDVKERRNSRLLLLSLNLTTLAVPALAAVFLSFSPCSMPAFMRSSLEDCPNVGYTLPLSGTFGILIMLMDCYYIGANYARGIFQLIFVWLFSSISLVNMLEKTLKATTGPADVKNAIQWYRKLQILERQINLVNRSETVPLTLCDLIIVTVMGIFCAVRLHNVLNLPMLMAVILISVECTACQLLAYRFPSNILHISKKLKTRMQIYSRRDKILRREVASCRIMRAEIGSSGNYFNETTPPMCAQTTLEQTASFLLIY